MLVSKSNKVPCCLCCTIVPCNMQVLLMRRKDDQRDKGREEDVCVKVLAECRVRGLLLGAAVDHGQLQDPSTTARPTPSSPFCICTYIHICFTICCTCLYFYLHLYMFHYLHIPFFLDLYVHLCLYLYLQNRSKIAAKGRVDWGRLNWDPVDTKSMLVQHLPCFGSVAGKSGFLGFGF